MKTKTPSFWLALSPILLLVGLLALNVVFYKDYSSYGPNQIALLIAGAFAALIGLRLGFKWDQMKHGMVNSISSTMAAIIILLLIGALAGTWVLSGIVPAMVYYGLQILNPEIFLFASCVISAIVSLATGSSWSTIATVGIALLGIGQAMDMHEGLTAGAIISGAYFGDKMSPLSDTTNLAPAMAGTDLFTHIRHMAWTTIPSIIITLIIFLIIGFSMEHEGTAGSLDGILTAIKSKFDITPLLFLVPLAVILMIVRKIPAIPSLLVGTILGAVFGIIFQPNAVGEAGSTTSALVHVEGMNSPTFQWTDHKGDVVETSDDFSRWHLTPGKYQLTLTDASGATAYGKVTIPDYGKSANTTIDLAVERNGNPVPTEGKLFIYRTSYTKAAYLASLNSMTNAINLSSSSEALEQLIAGKGMSGMLNTIWLIICAMAFGGVMETTGLLQRITQTIVGWARSRGGLIGATAGTCVFFNATASDQYLAIVVPGRMFAKTYRKRGLKPENLSRTLEDAGTVTSVLIPWNTCGATQSSVLGVSTILYAPFCFFNIISPIVTVIYGIVGFKVPKLDPEELENTPDSSSEMADQS